MATEPTNLKPVYRKPAYLGDGVYASFDGFQIRLATQRQEEHEIYLEPEVFAALLQYAKSVGWEIKPE